MPGHTTLAGPGESRFEVKKSQFLGLVAPVATVEEADAVVAARRKAHHAARHHATALILGEQGDLQRSNDDGEPAGSAGLPILSALRRAGVTDVVAVVTRYFGGTLLGVPGLARAYGEAATAALAGARVVWYEPAERLVLRCPHAVAGDFEHGLRGWLADHGAELATIAYDAEVAASAVVARADRSDFDSFVAPWLARGVRLADAAPARLARPREDAGDATDAAGAETSHRLPS